MINSSIADPGTPHLANEESVAGLEQGDEQRAADGSGEGSNIQ